MQQLMSTESAKPMPTLPANSPKLSGSLATKAVNQQQSGQFSYVSNPDMLWPDFLIGQSSQPLRVILVDGDARMCSVVKQELNLDARITLVGTGSNVREGKLLISKNGFDVMLVDAHLGDGLGLELISYMKTHRPIAEAVVISVIDDEHQAIKAFQQGAAGYLVKNSWFGNFSQAVLQVANGGAFISPNLARRLVQKLAAVHHAEIHAAPSHHGMANSHGDGVLSFREKEILELVASGYSSLEIASRISISGQTVTTHMKNIYRKLQVHSRAQAVMHAKSQGLLN